MKKTYILSLIAASMLILYACSDDSTSPGSDEPPSLPSDFTPAQVDMSFFEQNEIPNTEEHETYNQAKSKAIQGNSLLGAGGFADIGSSFIFFAQMMGIQPESDGNSWVWTINFSEDMFGPGFNKLQALNNANEEFTIRIVATPSGNSMNWQIYFTGDMGDGVVSDALLLSGETSNDSNSGTWNFHSPEHGGVSVMAYSWQKQSENSYTLTMNISDPESAEQFTVNYEKDGPENWLELNESGNTSNVYWNSNTNSGWVDENGQRSCFTNFEESTC